MKFIETKTSTIQATFAEAGTAFGSVLEFLISFSLTMWSLVILTTIFRFVAAWIYRRREHRAGSVTTTTSALTPDVPLAETSRVPLAENGGHRAGRRRLINAGKSSWDLVIPAATAARAEGVPSEIDGFRTRGAVTMSDLSEKWQLAGSEPVLAGSPGREREWAS